MTFDRLRQIADRLPEPEASWLAGVVDDLADGVPVAQALGEDATGRRRRRDRLLAEAVALLAPETVSEAVRALRAAHSRLARARHLDDLLRLVAAADAAYPIPTSDRMLFAIVRRAISNEADHPRGID